MAKKRFVTLGVSDKQAADRRADEFLRGLQQEQAGIIPSRVARDAVQKPLCKHLQKYLSDMRALECDAAYIYNVEKRITKLLRECGWSLLGDITAQSFQDWRARQNLAAKTLRDYQDAMSAFLNWMERSGLPSSNALKGVTRMQTKGKERVKRRAFTHDEFDRLLSVAGRRRIGYLAACFTGLRRAELARLQWGDVHLDAQPPIIAVRSSTTKNHQRSEIPLHLQLAEELRSMRPIHADAGDPVFTKGVVASMFKMKQDLKAAGILLIDSQGRRADFHSVRKSFNTHMALMKVDPHTRKELMRHSDICLTLDTYTDAHMLPLAQAIQCLPSFKQVATLGATNSDIFGHLPSLAGMNENLKSDAKLVESECIIRELAQHDAGGHEPQNGCLARTRT